MKLLKKTIFCIGILMLTGLFAKGWQLITDGLRYDKVAHDIKADQRLAIAEKDYQKIRPILDQKFKYLSKGCQTYVFESEDKNYVLKVIRLHRYELPFWLIKLDFPFFKEHKAKRMHYRSKLLNTSLFSYKFAYDFLKDETKIEYVHLSKTNYLNKKLEVFNRLNQKYLLDLDSTGFILQKKANSFEKKLNLAVNDDEKLKDLVKNFLTVITSLYRKGFVNADYNCVKNSGIFDGNVIFIDLGSFVKKDGLNNKETYNKELVHFTKYFKKWAKKKAPYIISYLDEQIEEFTSNYETDHKTNF